jgi:glycosyltransferase involved in cell wall biosynthesis
MRIFNIMVSRELGGIQQAYVDYSEALRLEGHEVINISSRNAAINERLVPSMKLPNLISWCLLSKLYIWVLALIHRPDIIISHGGRAINFAKAGKPKSVDLIGVAHNYTFKRLRKCDYVIVITEHLRRYMIDNGYDASRLFRIPNMLRISKPYQKKEFHKPVVIGSYGRFAEQKGYEYLLEAASLLKQRNYDFKLVLGGGGSDEAKLKSLAAELAIEDRTDFIGWVTDKDKFFEEIDVFCLSSIEEPFGIVLLETMEYSTPIVSTRCAGPNEIFAAGNDAILADVKSGADLADKLAELMDNTDMASQMAMLAYHNLVANYDIKIVAKKLSQIMGQISIGTDRKF